MKKVIISESESIALKDIIEHWFMYVNDENWTFDNGERYQPFIDNIIKKL